MPSEQIDDIVPLSQSPLATESQQGWQGNRAIQGKLHLIWSLSVFDDAEENETRT